MGEGLSHRKETLSRVMMAPEDVGVENETESDSAVEEEYRAFLVDRERYLRFIKLEGSSQAFGDLLVGCLSVAMLRRETCSGLGGWYGERIECERALQILLLGVRPFFRKKGVASKLLSEVLMRKIVESEDGPVLGKSDENDFCMADFRKVSIILVYADFDAVAFFTRQGFRDDPVMAGAYAYVVEAWENSSMLVRFTQYGETLCSQTKGSGHASNTDPPSVNRWREEKLRIYAQDVSIVEHLVKKVEVLTRKLEDRDREVAVLHKLLKEESALRKDFDSNT